ncbi:hypothetical protein LVJ85_10260 [Neisseria sp. Dent CA1/247]|uniref:hypothetical protein n=1 Tax=Neisseria sp. Dent CA1/247 TaxID=2912675 RepID=UPI001FD3BDF8|nr:hypothetical protein [Neisseria sp. Dent CA1/247]UOO76396.1 hypothetical protein LVJ85_10260 [Neisseria sp. Dent CA1/247]
MLNVEPKYSINNEVKLKNGSLVLITGIDQGKYGEFFYDYQSELGVGRVSEDEISHVTKENFYTQDA